VMEAALQNNENLGEQRALGVGSREFTSSAYQGEGIKLLSVQLDRARGHGIGIL
jgi:hypothetical protein